MKRKILFVEICNFIDYPMGGHLSFAKQMLKAFGNQLALVGMVTDDKTVVGKWTKKNIDGVIFDFFAVHRSEKESKKTIIPQRLKSYFAVRKNRNKILSLNILNIFVQTPEVLFALDLNRNYNLCCVIPGLENPLTISRYSYSKYFAEIFERFYFNSLKKSQIIFATGDDNALNNYIIRSKGLLDSKKIIKFPSRVNTSIFKPIKKREAKKNVGWKLSKKYIVTSGRLSELKGWRFMIDCFIEFRKKESNFHFIFIGDGEDKEKILDYINQKGVIDLFTLIGKVNHQELSYYLNAADLYVMGSYVEGWSTALVEAISCAMPVVCTNFSSAKDLTEEGFNGFVVDDRNVNKFVDKMVMALKLSEGNLLNKSKEMEKFSVDYLKRDILKYWALK